MWQRAVSAETIFCEKRIVCLAGIGALSCRTPVSGARWSCALFPGARIADIRVKQEHCAGTVSLQTEVRLEQLASSGEYAVCCTLTSPSGDELCVRGVSAEGMATACFVLESPQLWWPNMYGEQPLYALNVELQDKDGQVQDGWHKQIGLRELTVSRDQDEWGEEFCFRVNGVKIFAMARTMCPRIA